jgi:hypothetical protein
MTIQNFKYISRKGKVYIIDGVIELFNNTGFGFTKLLRINDVEEDSLPLRQKIKHEDILNFIKKIDKK